MSAARPARWAQTLTAFSAGLVAALLVWADALGQWGSLQAEAWAAASSASPAWPSSVASVPIDAASPDSEALPEAGASGPPGRPVDDPARPAPSRQAASSKGLPPQGLAWLPVLQAHGLQLQSLEHNSTDAVRPSLSLTLQGAWHDWLALERQAPAQLAAWVPQSWQVQALGPPATAGQVQLQWQLRWQGEAAAGPAPQSGLAFSDTAPGGPGAQTISGGEVFAAAAALADAGGQPSAASLTAQSGERWRLLGVWQQAGVPYALAESSGRVHTLRTGQRLGQTAARVQRIEDTQVWLGEDAGRRTLRPWPLGATP